MLNKLFVMACVCGLVVSAQGQALVELEPEYIGGLPGYNSSRPISISPDGSAAVGFAYNLNPNTQNTFVTTPKRLFRWTPLDGAVPFGEEIAGNLAITTSAHLSENGRAIAGRIEYTDNVYYWTVENGFTNILPAAEISVIYPNAISRDGSVVAGIAVSFANSPESYHVFRWTPQSGMELMTAPAGHQTTYAPQLISADGTIIAGGLNEGSQVFRPYRWATNQIQLLDLSAVNAAEIRDPSAMSDDGRVIAGAGRSTSNTVLHWVWVEGSPVQMIPFPSGATELRFAPRVRPDGSAVFGQAYKREAGFVLPTTAYWYIWTPSNGTQVVKQWTLPQTQTVDTNYIPTGTQSHDGMGLLLGAWHADEAYFEPEHYYFSSLGYRYALDRGSDEIERLMFPPSVSANVNYLGNAAYFLSADATAAVGSGTIYGFDPQFGIRYLYEHAYRWVSTAGFVVRNTSRLGNPQGALPGVSVRLRQSGSLVATNVTDARGRVFFSAQDVDFDALYDVELEAGNFRRTYQGIRPNEVIAGVTPIVLPVKLYQDIDNYLKVMETNDAFILSYDTSDARALLAAWNTDTPATVAVHAERDAALGRLLSATEAQATLYASAEKLSRDSGKMVASTIVAIMAYQKALADWDKVLKKQIAGQGDLAEYVARSVNFGVGSVLLSLQYAADQARAAFIASIKNDVPPWAAILLDQCIAAAVKGTLGGLSEGQWDATKGSTSARAALLESLILTLGDQVGGRILASAYVGVTESTLELAASRAEDRLGTGTVSQGYVASQGQVIAATERNDIALDASATVANVTKKVGYLANASVIAGKLPGLQVAALLGRTMRLLNIFATAGAAGNDLQSLYLTAFTDAPVSGDLAFFPPAPLSAVPSASTKSKRAFSGTPEPQAVAPASYTNRLHLLEDAVTANDTTNALTQGEFLLADEPALQAALVAEVLRIEALTGTADPARPALNAALAQLNAAMLTIQFARADMYLLIAHYLVPEITEPLDAPAEIYSQLLSALAAYRDALQTFEEAVALADAEATGIDVPPSLAVIEHGLHPASIDDTITPGPVEVRARVANIGGSTAEDVTVTLTPGTNSGPVTIFQLTNAAARVVGTLASGASTTLVWNGIATDISASGAGSAATYDLEMTLLTGTAANVSGGFIVESESTIFASLISDYSGTGSLTNFIEDADDDGESNGAELFFGTHPGQPGDAALWLDGAGQLPPVIRHQRSPVVPVDVRARYQWSGNLVDWRNSGDVDAGLGVTLNPVIMLGEGTNTQQIAVTPQITGASVTSLSFRVLLEQLPEDPPEPAPQPPEITAGPYNASEREGTTATFFVLTTGTEPMFYQWYKNGTLIPDAFDSDLVITNISIADNETAYHVRIINSGGSVTSSVAMLYLW